MTFPFPFMPPSVGATVTKTDDPTDDTSLTIYTLSALFGSGLKKIVACPVGSRATAGAKTVSSLIIDGTTASLVKRQNTSGGNGCEIWQANGITASSGNIVVTWSAGMQGCGVGVFAVYDAGSSSYASTSSTADPMNATIDVPAMGVLIGVGVNDAGGTFAWTNLTERYDEQYDAGGPGNHTGASDAFEAAQTALSVTCDPSAAGADNAMVLASWGPA